MSVQAESNSGQARGSGGGIVGSVESIKRSRGAYLDDILEAEALVNGAATDQKKIRFPNHFPVCLLISC